MQHTYQIVQTLRATTTLLQRVAPNAAVVTTAEEAFEPLLRLTGDAFYRGAGIVLDEWKDNPYNPQAMRAVLDYAVAHLPEALPMDEYIEAALVSRRLHTLVELEVLRMKQRWL